jgi:transcription elongation factor GreA
MANITYLTREGMDRLKEELHDMRTTQRADISNAISEARDKGDLSENAEYDAAKEAQGHLELKISQLEDVLSNARVLDDSSVDISKVHILSAVTLLNSKTNQKVTYRLVSVNEADIKQNKISVDSPIGKGLLGRAVGDKVEISVPAGKVELTILEINR